MAQTGKVAIAPCPNPKCGKPVWSDHNDAWCYKCGEYFPDDFAVKLPRLLAYRASRQNTRVDAESQGVQENRSATILKKSLRLRTFFTVVGAYLSVIIALGASASSGILVFFLLYAAICAAITYSLIREEAQGVSREATHFNKNFPLRPFGSSLLNFQHVFSHQESVLESLRQEIDRNLRAKNSLPSLTKKILTDTDKELIAFDSRTFFITSSTPTPRETTLTLAVHLTEKSNMQSIEWWILAYGFVDPNKTLYFVSSSFLTLPFWFITYIKREYDLINPVRTIYPSFYNSMDLGTEARFIHTTVYDALVDVLDKYGIDTSELKQGRSQNLSVHVSGGQPQFGNIVQGAMNKIMTTKREVTHGKA